MAKKESPAAPADKVALYEKLVATNAEAELKGATMPYTSFNGNMSSYLHPSGTVALRLPAEAREAFLKKHKAYLMEAYGIVQKEYVAVPDALLKKTTELKPYFKASVDYVKSLKPKPTKKK
ncbi:MAG: hypothetical protein JST82_12995 [Bacteroidetes bacterium]|nr:hypothetical protein [Bacteroidota bacterium]